MLKKFINKAAKKVTKAVGGAKLADYAGAKYAKRKLKGTAAQKYVKDTTTKKEAMRSGAKVLATIGGMAAGGAIAGLRAATKATKLAKVVKKFPTATQMMRDEALRTVRRNKRTAGLRGNSHVSVKGKTPRNTKRK